MKVCFQRRKMKRLLNILFVLLLLVPGGAFGVAVHAQTNQLAGTYGTEFWLGFLRNNFVEPDHPTMKVTICAVAEEAVTIVVAPGSNPSSQYGTITIPAGGGFGKLENIPPASVVPTKDEAQSPLDKGVVIYAKDGKTKFSCYAITKAGEEGGYTRDATLLLPKDLLGKEYFVQTYPTDTRSTQFLIVAPEGGTEVTITPSVPTSKKSAANTPITVTLAKGQSYLVQSAPPGEGESMDLSGSTICSDKPIAVFAGNEATMIPSPGYWVNHTYEQVIPQTMWGNDFYVALAGGTKRNMYTVTTSMPNTTVTVKAYDRKADKVNEISQTIAKAGGTLTAAPLMMILRGTEETADAYIHSDKPILCYTYLTSGPANVDDYDNIWGNSTNAMVVPWSHRTKEMSFFTAEIDNKETTASQKHFVQIVTTKNDADNERIKLDGVKVPAAQFAKFGGDENMRYANVELTTHGKHHLSSTGTGFTGFVHGMNSESRAQEYTLGFDPPKYLDSLFIENQGEIMSHKSYDYINLPYMEDKGWYQRQPVDFPIDKQRIDTAIVCDSSVVNFFGMLATQNSGDSVVWKIWECDAKGKKLPQKNPIIVQDDGGALNRYGVSHKFEHQFVLEDLPPEKRTPFTFFSVDMEKYKRHLICTTLDPDADTLRTMVRVNREYNDTTWRIVCETDTIHFFEEVPAERFVKGTPSTYTNFNKKTIFQFDKENLSQNIVRFKKEDNTYTRWYKSVNGCDSIVTLKIYGCDTLLHVLDTTVCEAGVKHLRDSLRMEVGRTTMPQFTIKTQDELKELKKSGALAPYSAIYKDGRKTKSCLDDTDVSPEKKKIIQAYRKNCPDFQGCPDTFEVRLTVMPLLYTPNNNPQIQAWCVGDDPTETYDGWIRFNETNPIRKITQDDPAFDNTDHIGYFSDTVFYPICTTCPDKKRCPKEITQLRLRKVDSKPVVEEVHICQNETYTHMTFMQKDRKTYKGWELPLGQQPDETHQVDVVIAGKKECEFTATLKLFVHPAYVKTTNMDTEIKENLYTCIAKKESDDHFEWPNHADHDIWLISENGTTVKKKVKANEISTQKSGTYVFIDSLKTKTCTECRTNDPYEINRGTCDSVHRLTLFVAPEHHKNKRLDFCQNKELEYIFEGNSYYFYAQGYKGTKKTPYEIIDTTLYMNRKCDDMKVYVPTTKFEAKSVYGCDSIHELQIWLWKTFQTVTDTFICETSTYKFDGKEYKWAYDHSKTPDENVYTLKPTNPMHTHCVCECDSDVTHIVHVRPVYGKLQDKADTVCQSQTDDEFYTWTNHPKAGEPVRDIWMIQGSQKKKVKSNAIPLNVAGTFTLRDELTTKTCPDCKGGGCDSIWERTLTIIPTYNNKFERQLSSEGYWLWDDTLFLGGTKAVVPGGITYKHKIVVPGMECYTHTQHHTTRDADGRSVGTKTCDSIVTWCLKVGKVFRDTTYAPVCSNCEYKWHIVDPNTGKTKDIIITNVPKPGETKWYYDSTKTVMNFDSIYNLQLTGFTTYYNDHPSTDTDSPVTDEVCQGSVYDKWTGHPGQRDELYIVKGGVATAVKTNDFIKTISKEYGTYLIRDSMKATEYFYNPKTKQKEKVQCDSIWELTLTVHPTYSKLFNYDKVDFPAYLCSNDTLLWNHRLFVGYDYDTEAHPLTKPSSATPYDSIVYIPKKANLQFYDSVKWAFGTKTFGCDSTNYVTIYISRYDTTWLKEHIGDNNTHWAFGGKGGTFKYNGKTRITREDLVASSSVDYSDASRHEVKQFFFIDTIPSVLTGCDSIVWDSLYIHPSYRFQFDTLLCSNNDWDWRKYKNVNTFVTGYYYDSLTTEPYKIDSVFVLNLTIQPGAKHYFGRNICKNDTVDWELQRIYYEENKGDIEVKYKTGSDCDSILIFQPKFYEYYHFKEERLHQIAGYGSDSICRFDTLIWISEGETAPHTAALRGEKGESYKALPTDTIGWITIYDSLHTTAPCHCDSTYMLRYYVKPAYRFYDTATICSNDTLEWRGQILYSDTAAIIHTKDSYATLNGSCDSIYYLTLFVNQAYDSVRYDTICGNLERFEWEGHNMTDWLKRHLVDTLPSDTFLLTRYDTQLECDSVFKLYLNVRPILTEEWSDTVCVGETYTLNDKHFTTSGVYTDTLTNSFGCDSFAVVHLAVVPATYFKVEPVTVCSDYGEFDMLFTFDTLKGFPPREVRVVYDSLAQACGFPKDTVTLPVNGNSVLMELPDVKEEYVRPNNYSASIYFDNGTCDDPEMQRVDLRFTVNYPSWLLEQHWADAIGILAPEYNGDYTFSAYQWYKDGEKLVGETKPYYFAPQYLEVGAEYSVELTRVGDSLGIMTCAIIATKRDNTLTPQKPYVSVVPAYVVKDNPVVHILCSQYGGEYKLYNPYGSLIQSGRFEPGEHNAYEVRLPALTGIYMFELIQENGEQRTVKVLVN